MSLLARQTGFGQAHLSNFLRMRRQLSLDAMDRVLRAQHLAVADLLPALGQPNGRPDHEELHLVPVVSHAAALFEPLIRPSVTESMLRVPSASLELTHARTNIQRRAWQRFVAVHLSQTDAAAMEPLVQPESVALIDRHYTSLITYKPDRANLYAVRHGSHLKLRYAEFLSNRLVLRPYNIAFPVELVEVDPGESPNDHLAGRVLLIQNEL